MELIEDPLERRIAAIEFSLEEIREKIEGGLLNSSPSEIQESLDKLAAEYHNYPDAACAIRLIQDTITFKQQPEDSYKSAEAGVRRFNTHGHLIVELLNTVKGVHAVPYNRLVQIQQQINDTVEPILAESYRGFDRTFDVYAMNSFLYTVVCFQHAYPESRIEPADIITDFDHKIDLIVMLPAARNVPACTVYLSLKAAEKNKLKIFNISKQPDIAKLNSPQISDQLTKALDYFGRVNKGNDILLVTFASSRLVPADKISSNAEKTRHIVDAIRERNLKNKLNEQQQIVQLADEMSQLRGAFQAELNTMPFSAESFTIQTANNLLSRRGEKRIQTQELIQLGIIAKGQTTSDIKFTVDILALIVTHRHNQRQQDKGSQLIEIPAIVTSSDVPDEKSIVAQLAIAKRAHSYSQAQQKGIFHHLRLGEPKSNSPMMQQLKEDLETEDSDDVIQFLVWLTDKNPYINRDWMRQGRTGEPEVIRGQYSAEFKKYIDEYRRTHRTVSVNEDASPAQPQAQTVDITSTVTRDEEVSRRTLREKTPAVLAAYARKFITSYQEVKSAREEPNNQTVLTDPDTLFYSDDVIVALERIASRETEELNEENLKAITEALNYLLKVDSYDEFYDLFIEPLGEQEEETAMILTDNSVIHGIRILIQQHETFQKRPEVLDWRHHEIWPNLSENFRGAVMYFAGILKDHKQFAGDFGKAMLELLNAFINSPELHGASPDKRGKADGKFDPRFMKVVKQVFGEKESLESGAK